MNDDELNVTVDAEIARRKFIKDHLSNLPEPYHALIGRDPSKWAAEALAAVNQANEARAKYLADESAAQPPLTPQEQYPHVALNTAKQAQAIKIPASGVGHGGSRKESQNRFLPENTAKQAQAMKLSAG